MISSQFVSRVTLRNERVDSFDHYPFALPVVRSLDNLDFHPKVTFFVGENGSGKSTVMEALAIALGFNAEGGSKNFRFSTRASHSPLHDCIRVTKGFKSPKDGFFLRAESFFNVATEVETRHAGQFYGKQSLHEQSHGESFLALMYERFFGNGLYLLDEPEAALSPSRQLAVLARIHELVLNDSQFIIATHSPILMAYPEATIFQFGQDGIHQIAYEDTEHYQVTKDFLQNPNRMLKVLLNSPN